MRRTRGNRGFTFLARLARGGLLLLAMAGWLSCASQPMDASPTPGPTTELPPPRREGETSLEEAIAQRRSKRSFTGRALTEEEISQLLWAAQGITDERGHRAAPSAGALYPLELYVVTGDGLYHYLPEGHRVDVLATADLREAVWEAGLRQDALREAPVIFVFTAVYERTEAKYGDRAERYVHLEAGHAAQNLLLEAVALDLGAVPIGAFHASEVQQALSLPEDRAPLYLIPVGEPAS